MTELLSENEIIIKEHKNDRERRKWERYVSGDIIHDILDMKAVNSYHSWLTDQLDKLPVKEYHDHMEMIAKSLILIEEEMMDPLMPEMLDNLNDISKVLKTCHASLLQKWTETVFEQCGTSENKNEVVEIFEHYTLSFWRSNTEKKKKILFFSGIQIEASSFMQALRIEKMETYNSTHVEEILKLYPAGYLFEYAAIRKQVESMCTRLAELEITDTLVLKPKKKKKKKKNVKKTRETQQTRNKKQKSQICENFESVINALITDANKKKDQPTLYTEKKPDWIDKQNTEPTHQVDFTSETFLGCVYRLTVYDTGGKSKQFGSWLLSTATQLTEHVLSGESLQIGLKVPVEEVFIGPNEPVVAFCEDGGTEWKKGVYTTHTQFDQNSFVLNTRLSRLGRVALFQQNDFHFPFRRWNIEFIENDVIMELHTSSVELKFRIEGSYINLETQTGDEFSKLRSLHQVKLTIADMARRLLQRGVFIFPQKENLRKQRDTYKKLKLELHCYYLVAYHKLNCSSSKNNSTVSNKCIVVDQENASMQLDETSSGDFVLTPAIKNIYESVNTSSPTELNSRSTLFRWLMLIRPISMTK